MEAVHKAICIDPKARTVTTADLTFEGAQKYVGGWLEPLKLDEANMLLVDEEGRLKRIEHTFRIGTSMPLVGRAVIFGTAGSEFVDTSLTVNEVAALTEWM